jgi:hypothetical protein
VPTPDLQLTTVPERWRPSDGQLDALAGFLIDLARAQPDQSPPVIQGPPPGWWCGCAVPHQTIRRLLVGVLRMEANGRLEWAHE